MIIPANTGVNVVIKSELCAIVSRTLKKQLHISGITATAPAIAVIIPPICSVPPFNPPFDASAKAVKTITAIRVRNILKGDVIFSKIELLMILRTSNIPKSSTASGLSALILYF